MTMANTNRELVREALLAAALATAEEVDEYITEFEHMEGDDCWETYFKTTDEVVTDFKLYLGVLNA